MKNNNETNNNEVNTNELNDNEINVNEEYKRIMEAKIVEYTFLHGKDDCRWTKMLKYIANDEDVQYARGLRNYEQSKEAFRKDNNADITLYKEMYRKALKKLIKEKKIQKFSNQKNMTKYGFVGEKPKVTNLYNDGIAIMQVEQGKEKETKAIIEANIEDPYIIIIPLDGFLLCTKKNPRDKKFVKSQTPYIRKMVRRALLKADCKVVARKAKHTEK